MNSRLLKYCSIVSIAMFFAGGARPQKQTTMTGFSPAAADRQSGVEKRFKDIPKPEEARRWHRYFTAEPHPAGSERNNELARYIADQWKQQGLEDVILHRYDVLNSFPREVSVEMVAPKRYKASLKEDGYDVDPDTKNPNVRTGYLGMSASGDVTAPLVYAHSGNPEDYALLRQQGIDVKGKVVIVRYSNPYSYRGFKALTAQREGVAAMLVYSDPAEDGFKKGKVFPDGPWGPESHIQRGAITYDFIVPGDPLTPGWASVEGAKRISISDAQSLPKIIAVAMSWHDAKPLLESLDGPEAPADWQGGLPIKYHFGGGAVRVHVKADMDTRVMPNYVVEGRIRGSELPDEWVVLGNHRDAWEFGGVDPSSGTASLMEMTRAFGELKNQGVRPRRTLVFCSWDGEEVGLTGSTEWGEQFADDLRVKGVAYINVDSSVSGPNFSATLSASGASLIVEVSKSLQDPSGKSLYEAWKESSAKAQNTILGARAAATTDESLPNTRIGSGSDHTVFLNYVGIPVFDLGFNGPYGVYHSMYDDHFWMEHFGDPGFKYHALMSQVWGVLALRLGNAEVLPLDFAAYASNIRQYARDLATVNKINNNLDLQILQRRTVEMQDAGRALQHAVLEKLSSGGISAAASNHLNQQIRQVEQNFLNPAGLPGRPWFKHMLYACRYTYAHLELPGLAEAVEAKNWMRAKEQAAVIESALATNTALLRTAREELALPVAATGTKSLEEKIEVIRRNFPGEMSVYMKNLSTGEELALDADRVMETFSVIKVPIMAEVFRRAEMKEFSLSDRITMKAGDARLPSGLLYTMDPGLQPTIRDLITLMIIISDNAATDMLGDRMGRANITKTMHSIGLEKTSIEFSDLDWDRRWLGSLDSKFLHAPAEEIMKFPFDKFKGAQVTEAFRHTIYESDLYFGHSTVRDIGHLFEKMARGELISKSASEQMIAILKKQQVNNRFPKYLRGTEIAHKTGDGQPHLANDAGILWINGQPIVLVVFTGHHRGETSTLHDAIARVAALVGAQYGARLSADYKPL